MRFETVKLPIVPNPPGANLPPEFTVRFETEEPGPVVSVPPLFTAAGPSQVPVRARIPWLPAGPVAGFVPALRVPEVVLTPETVQVPVSTLEIPQFRKVPGLPMLPTSCIEPL